MSEKEMAPNSSILAWKIPWTEESGGLQSMGLQRVRHDWVHTRAHTHTHHMHYKWLNGCACEESTCYAAPRLEYKTTFLNGFWYLLIFFLGIHLTYFERQLQLAAFRTFMKVTHRKMHHWSYLQTSINSLLWCSSVSNCSIALPVIPHIRVSFYSPASLPRCSCLTIYMPEHVTFD